MWFNRAVPFGKMQVCISFLLHRGLVVIPKSVNPKRIAENFKATQVLLDADEIKRLEDVDKNCRLFKVTIHSCTSSPN